MTAQQTDSAEDGAYREAARAWLAMAAAEYRAPPSFSDVEMVRRAKAWVRTKWEAGYSAIALPKDVGGAGGTARQAQIFAEEERRYKAPLGLGPGSALGMAAISKHGSHEQFQKWGTLTHSGGAYWCQLFSEPSAGSDLAGLRTRAVRKGDKWIINGQKVWSSWAHHSDYGILLARTDPGAPKHKGISFFVINMHQPGVTVRPTRQITGHADFNEVFFEDAEVEAADLIGSEGEGWACAMTVLQAERNAAGAIGGGGGAAMTTMHLIQLARDAKRENGTALDSAAIRAKIAQWHVEEQGVKNFALRMQQQIAQGEPPPATLPIMKLTSANYGQQVQSFLMDLDEYGGLVQEPGASGDKFYPYLWSAVMRIAGGADEVLRNQLSERALGMPGDMRADKDVPFDTLPA